MKRPQAVPGPWLPSTYQKADIYALRALSLGEANDEQQRRALAFITALCGTYDLSFRPGAQEGDRDTAFAEGKRFVGLQIVKLVNMSNDLISKMFEKP